MATKILTSLALRCPLCGAEGATLGLNLNALDTISCDSCNEIFSPKEARAKVMEQLTRWDGLLAWLATAPVVE